MSELKSISSPKGLLCVERGIIAHQVNCQGAFGAGLAKAIATKYPSAKSDYLRFVEAHRTSGKKPESLLGTILASVPQENKNLIIIHMFAQLYYGNAKQTNKVYTHYGAFADCMTKIRSSYPDYTIHLPYLIGCGLAGGDWNIVSDILRQHSDHVLCVKLV